MLRSVIFSITCRTDRKLGYDCSEHQRNLMALWILHTHCFSVAQVTPYLSIQSAEKQAGKSLCLQLLSLLAPDPALGATFTASSLSRRTDHELPTVLLDECNATLGTRLRSRSPLLRAVLASGFQRGIGFTDATHERNLFAPKAFAGTGGLPDALADRSISIILEPKKKGSKVRRFNLLTAGEEAQPLQHQLALWAESNLPQLATVPPSQDDFPPSLTPRRHDMIEPLLRGGLRCYGFSRSFCFPTFSRRS